MVVNSSEITSFGVGDNISWKWYGGVIDGIILEVYQTPIERLIKGKRIKRNGSPGRPAYLVESEAGNLALKLHSEVYQKN